MGNVCENVKAAFVQAYALSVTLVVHMTLNIGPVTGAMGPLTNHARQVEYSDALLITFALSCSVGSNGLGLVKMSYKFGGLKGSASLSNASMSKLAKRLSDGEVI
jgi:hypothetical protein